MLSIALHLSAVNFCESGHDFPNPNACMSDVGIPGFATLLLFLAVRRHVLFSYQWGIYQAYLLILMEVSGLYTLRQYI